MANLLLLAQPCCTVPTGKAAEALIFNEGVVNAVAGVKAPAFIRKGQELPHSLTHPHVLERCSQSPCTPCIGPTPVPDAGTVEVN